MQDGRKVYVYIYIYLIYKGIYIHVYEGVLGSLPYMTQDFRNILSLHPVRCSFGILEANKTPDRYFPSTCTDRC